MPSPYVDSLGRSRGEAYLARPAFPSLNRGSAPTTNGIFQTLPILGVWYPLLRTVHVVSEDHAINRDRKERVKYFGFTALVGVLLLLNFFGIFDTFMGVDTALFLMLLAGYKTFYNAISDLLERKISADLLIVIAAIAATFVGEYLAAAEAMFIMLVGEGLEAGAAGRTEAAIHRFVDQLPRHATVLRDGREVEVHVEDLVPGDVILI